jgi:AraC-like DNA-binding protein
MPSYETLERLMDDSIRFEYHWGIADQGFGPHHIHPWRVLPCLVMVHTHHHPYSCRFRDGRRFVAEPGEIILIPAGIFHELRYRDHGILTGLHLQFTILGGKDILSFYDVSHLVKPDKTARIAGDMVDLIHLHNEGQTSIRAAVRRQKVAFRLLDRILEVSSPVPERISRMNEVLRVQPALSYVGKNLSSAITRKQLADLCCLSVSHFTRLFHDITGLPPQKYIQHLRIQRAITLLRDTSRSIQQVAEALGYCDPFHFSHQFRKITGITPSSCRKDMNRIARNITV